MSPVTPRNDENAASEVRQTSVCRWLPLRTAHKKPRQTEVCRTFSEEVSLCKCKPSVGSRFTAE